MGAVLEKPCMSTVVERQANAQFVCVVSELNGHRNSMEDAHVIHMREEWGAFGVFDGHGGEQCSKWIADRFNKEFESNGCPKDDAAVKDLYLQIDQEFLDLSLPSGTTATMCIVHKPQTSGSKHVLRVINAGDSRVLLGKRDGTIVDGNGTDLGLTTDHKPNHPSERERIESNGGHVEIAAGGVARLNGDLAVSRGFGDADYKKQGEDPKNLEKQPATASPEQGRFECDETDFVLLVCDGVSEGEFSNKEVVELVAEKLKEHDDPGAAATAVVHRAVNRGSKDNVTCMILLLQGSGDVTKTKVLNPGSIYTTDKTFMKCYEAMASRANKTLAEAVEMRYDQIQEGSLPKGCDEWEKDPKNAGDQRKDLELIGSPKGDKGSEERSQWFQQRIEELQQDADNGDGEMSSLPPALAAMLRQRVAGPGGFSPASGSNKERAGTIVCMPQLAELKESIESNSCLKWDSRMEDLATLEGTIEEDDDSDGTTKVKFENVGATKSNMIAWIPTKVLILGRPEA
jgi:protein phosphatase